MPNNNQRNLIITIVAAVMVIVYLSILNLSKKTTNNTAANTQCTESTVNLDRLYSCMNDVNKLVEDQSDLVAISGKLNSCLVEAKNLYIKKTMYLLPETMNFDLKYKVMVNKKEVESTTDKDGLHTLVVRKESNDLTHCSSNLVDLTVSEKFVSFIPAQGNLFLICVDPKTKDTVVYYSTDWKMDELNKLIDGTVLDITKVQNNQPKDEKPDVPQSDPNEVKEIVPEKE